MPTFLKDTQLDQINADQLEGHPASDFIQTGNIVAIKTAYESNVDTNAFTDAEKSKLANLGVGDLVDVNLSSLASGEILKYNGTSWENAPDAGTGGGGTLDETLTLGNTSLQGMIVGDLLVRDNVDGRVKAGVENLSSHVDSSAAVEMTSNGDTWSITHTQSGEIGTEDIDGYTTKILIDNNNGIKIGLPIQFENNYTEKPVQVLNATIDVRAGTYFYKSFSVPTTLSFYNLIDSTSVHSFTFELYDGGSYAITWPTSVKWAYGDAPQLTVHGTDILAFHTRDGGLTWYGYIAGLDMQ